MERKNRNKPMKVAALLTLVTYSAATPVIDASQCQFTIDEVSAGSKHTCVRISDDSYRSTIEERYIGPFVKCFGVNKNGALGLGSGEYTITEGETVPFVNLEVDKTREKDLYRDLFTGGLATCLRDSGRASDSTENLRCWGQLGLSDEAVVGNDEGEMGLKLARVTMENSGEIRQPSIGLNNGCLITTGSEVQCWGHTSTGIVEATSGETFVDFPGKVVLGRGDLNDRYFEKVAVGDNHACAHTQDKLFCWGCKTCNDPIRSKVLATYNLTVLYEPVYPFPVMPTTLIRQIVAGSDHTCILYNNGLVRCFGDDYYGQLGLLGEELGTPVNFGEEDGQQLYTATRIDAGDYFNCAWLKYKDGPQFNAFAGIKCWGANGARQLGLADKLARGLAGTTLEFVTGLPNSVKIDLERSIALGSNHACASFDNELMCWGDIPGAPFRKELLEGTARVAPLCTKGSESGADTLLIGIGVMAGIGLFGVAAAFASNVMSESSLEKPARLPVTPAVPESSFNLGSPLTSSTMQQTIIQSVSKKLKQNPGSVFDVKRVVTQLTDMGLSFDEVILALSTLRNTVATIFSTDDSNAVRKARIHDLTKKFKAFDSKSHGYAVFVSHSQTENEWTRLMSSAISSDIGDPVFCDLDAGLENLEHLGGIVRKSANLVILLSEQMVTSPWCILEVMLAIEHDIKLHPVVLGKFDYSKLEETIKLLKDSASMI